MIIHSTVEIGFERTVYTVTETEGSVEVCGIIYSSVLSRTVTVRVESSDGTAGTYESLLICSTVVVCKQILVFLYPLCNGP